MATSRSTPGLRVATVFATLARVAVGVLWINEGILKFVAGFGKADILLVVQSTAQNSRVPDFYKAFTANVLGALPELFGMVVPIIEFGLGVALVCGIFTLPAALISVIQLGNYWLADQLITQYPIMLLLSVAVAVFAISASRFSVTSAIVGRRAFPAALRRWV